MAATDGAILFEILRGEPGATATPERIDALFDLATAHGLAGLVHEALEKRGVILPRWQAFAEQTELGAKVQLQAAAEIADALRARNIEAVFVKGVALSLSVYPRALRPFNDLDLLIQPRDLRAVHGILTGMGFSANNSLRSPIELDYFRERLPGYKICIDLHWDFTGEDGFQAPVRMPLGEILSRCLRERDIPVPTPEDALLFSAANFARKCGEPLVLVVDFARMLQLPLDWKKLTERAEAWGLKTPLWLALTLAEHLLGAKAPNEWLNRLSPPAGRAQRLTEMLGGEALWLPDKQKRFGYRWGFKLKCLDSAGAVCAALCASPRGVLRKLGLTENLAAKILRENPPPLTSPDRA